MFKDVFWLAAGCVVYENIISILGRRHHSIIMVIPSNHCQDNNCKHTGPNWARIGEQKNLINSEVGQDTSACQISGHFFHAFSKKWPQRPNWPVSLIQSSAQMKKSTDCDQNLIRFAGGPDTSACQISNISPMRSAENTRKSLGTDGRMDGGESQSVGQSPV